MLARFRKKTRRNKGNKIESEEKCPYVKTRFFTSRKRRGTLSLSFVARSPSSFPCLSKMTDADMVEAPASTADAAAAAADASAAAAAKALAKGKAPVTANASSADALARAAATAASAPWVEKYRPNTLDDVASHGEIIETSEWRYRWKRRGKEKKRRRLMASERNNRSIAQVGSKPLETSTSTSSGKKNPHNSTSPPPCLREPPPAPPPLRSPGNGKDFHHLGCRPRALRARGHALDGPRAQRLGRPRDRRRQAAGRRLRLDAHDLLQ
jgi:hypothetical protein